MFKAENVNVWRAVNKIRRELSAGECISGNAISFLFIWNEGPGIWFYWLKRKSPWISFRLFTDCELNWFYLFPFRKGLNKDLERVHFQTSSICFVLLSFLLRINYLLSSQNPNCNNIFL